MEIQRSLVTAIEELESDNEILINNFHAVNNSLKTLLRTLNIAEQKILYNYVEIIGVPAERDKCIFKIVKQIGDYLGIELSVLRFKRLGYDQNTKTMRFAAELSTFKQKIALMRSARMQKLSTDCFVEKEEARPIFINDYLSDHFRSLFNTTKLFAKHNGFKYVWYKKCFILLKKNNRCTTFKIESATDLQKIGLL